MPRFTDQWLIDRILFDYLQGGSCACCSFSSALFLPNGTKGLIETMSELETDAANAEIRALDQLPWPPEMKDQVWMERVRLRHYLRKQFKEYREFWQQHGTAFEAWFTSSTESSSSSSLLSSQAKKLRRLLQLPRSEIMERFNDNNSNKNNTTGNTSSPLTFTTSSSSSSSSSTNFRLHAAFGTVLCAVTEQVAHFPLTGLPPDGRGRAELEFEQLLTFDSRGGGFTLKDIDSPETKRVWLLRHQTLGGPQLLERNSKKPRNNNKDDDDNDDEDDDDDADAAPTNQQQDNSVPSFRSDRRIVRLLIARHFADVLQQAFLKDLASSSSQNHKGDKNSECQENKD